MDLTPEQLEAAKAALQDEMRDQFRTEFEEEFKSKTVDDNSEVIEKLVNERLSQMKTNVDKAYGKVDELAKENLRLKEAEKEAARKRMEDEGKHLELSQMKVTELQETIQLQKEQLTTLTRDQKVKDILVGKDFKNDFTRQVAFDHIVKNLVEDEQRGWVHKSGASVEEYFEMFSKDPEHKDVLFKPKENNGAGASPHKSVKGTRPTSLKELSTTEMLELAANGDFGEFSFD